MSRTLSTVSVVRTFARSLLIQGSWNYRTMIGVGFGWAMLPGLRGLFDDRPGRLGDALVRHTEHFNAHPYLSNVALGAVLRLEADGADAETVRKFKTAVRGPLGGLGDSLVWATFLPAVSMAALAVYWLGLPGPAAAAVFLVLYNIGHVGLRAWGFHAGLETGREVGARLAAAQFVHWTRRLRKMSVVLLGAVMGILLTGDGGLEDAGIGWAGLAAAGFVVGLMVGQQAWRPTAVVVVSVIAGLATWGVIR